MGSLRSRLREAAIATNINPSVVSSELSKLSAIILTQHFASQESFYAALPPLQLSNQPPTLRYYSRHGVGNVSCVQRYEHSTLDEREEDTYLLYLLRLQEIFCS